VVNILARDFIAHVLAKNHRDAGEKIKELIGTWRERDYTDRSELLYALGLAAMIAKAAELGMDVMNEEATLALLAARLAVQKVLKPNNASHILAALSPLKSLAPHYYASFLAASSIDDVVYFYLNELLEKHQRNLEERVWPLAYVVEAYIRPLMKRPGFSSEEKRGWVLNRVRSLLLRFRSAQLYAIAESYVVALKLVHGFEDAEEGAVKLRRRLEKMMQESPDKYAREWAEARSFHKPEKVFTDTVKSIIETILYHLARYKMVKGEVEEAEKIFEELAEMCKKRGKWGRYLSVSRSAVHCSALATKSLEELKEKARDFRGLWKETLRHRVHRA